MKVEQFQESIQAEPTQFYDDVLGCSYWSAQQEITESVFRELRTTVKSCHGPGKTYIAARIALAFLYAHRKSLVITTAPTFKQVENQIWRELREAHAESKIDLGGKILKTKLELGEKWYAMGVSCKEPTNVQGYHAEHVLIIVDEAAGVAPIILDALEGGLTSANVHVLYIGNPTISWGPFYDSHKSSLWNKISISAFDTPNFRANRIRKVDDLKKFKDVKELLALKIVNPNLVTPLWAWDRLHHWGEDSPMFQAKVMAIFPTEGSDTLIKLADVEAALEKTWDEKEWMLRPRVNVIGIDVARFGEDTTVFTAMDNLKMLDLDWHNGKDTMRTVGKGIRMFKELGFKKEFDLFVIDDTGLGGGVSDRLNELGYHVLRVNFGEAADDAENYYLIKAEIYWSVRRVFLEKQIRILDKGKLVGQMPTMRYDMTSKGQIEIVNKKKMKKDGQKSPDFADSTALAIWGVLNWGSNEEVTNPELGKAPTVIGDIRNKRF